jgi:hypothetical protein
MSAFLLVPLAISQHHPVELDIVNDQEFHGD